MLIIWRDRSFGNGTFEMAVESGFPRAVEAIYAAAATAALWPQVLHAIAARFEDIGANLIYRGDDGTAATILSPGLQTAHKDYEAGQWDRDIRWTRALEFVYRSHSGAITDRHLVSNDEQRAHPFYTEFQRKHGLHWITSIEVSPEPFVVVALSMHREPTSAAYTDDELGQLTRIGRHVEQALRLSIGLIRAELTNIGLIDVLSDMRAGVFVLDANANVLFKMTLHRLSAAKG